jgi:hypothetical protein
LDLWTGWRIQGSGKRAKWVLGERAKMKGNDKSRKWMWMFLAALVSLQMYFVWELLAVFALFAVGFAALAFVAGSLYMLHRGWALAVDRVADSRHPIMVATRQGIDAIEDAARRPFRRPGSATAR